MQPTHPSPIKEIIPAPKYKADYELQEMVVTTNQIGVYAVCLLISGVIMTLALLW